MNVATPPATVTDDAVILDPSTESMTERGSDGGDAGMIFCSSGFHSLATLNAPFV